MTNPNVQRFHELLVERYTVGLDASGEAELVSLQQALQKEEPGHDWQAEADEIELAIAAADQFLSPEAEAEMPSGIADRVLSAIDELPSSGTEPGAEVVNIDTRRTAEKPGRTQWLGWYAAAASLLAAIYFGFDRQVDPVVPSLAEQRAEMLTQSDVQTIAWATPTEPGYEQVSGDVVWNNRTQQGFMRLVNLPVNDPGNSQYQLWIVDPNRDQHPVDGGVFDISSTGEVLIPIDAKLPIISPAAFAITREQPGGVVVSAGPLLVVAAVEA